MSRREREIRVRLEGRLSEEQQEIVRTVVFGKLMATPLTSRSSTISATPGESSRA